MPAGCQMRLEAVQEQIKLIIIAHNAVLSVGGTQKATIVGDMAGHEGFNEGLLLPCTECDDSGVQCEGALWIAQNAGDLAPHNVLDAIQPHAQEARKQKRGGRPGMTDVIASTCKITTAP